ncbi:N-alpha-acetyltransferase 30 [Hondaea fermentalgiana]|uniref:N-alpha-acetyltransferase 30 n=1 Tax=Hondaea fermentalgiana TaxID=2315210 RepID=A0A2R5G9S4_9STRA|nr:N-alpha-acetyltransferase 30 [Hondaea fermentalgiana]|eukprot:GBG26488.1 N-alpha-acetyltransferase 30 [Hondaea fermentalgiana]
MAAATKTVALGPEPARADDGPRTVGRRGSIRYDYFKDESELGSIIAMIDKDLSEPYSIYTYRYFIRGWPKLCIIAYDEDQEDKMVGVIVCKADHSRRQRYRGYIAMLAVDTTLRRKRIGSSLVTLAIREMVAIGCDEAVLETEITNKAAMRLYENLGFYRDKRLCKYYLNGVDAFRLKLWLKDVSDCSDVVAARKQQEEAAAVLAASRPSAGAGAQT